MRAGLAALLLGAAFSTSAQAAGANRGEPRADKADPKVAEAKVHFKQGSAFYKQARYREAIAEFEKAYQLKPHGALRFNIAQCHERLGEIPQALRSYRAYLREVPDAEDKTTVRTAMANLEKRLVEKGLQQLSVDSQPPGAAVHVGGSELGRTPWSGELALGRHQVRVSLTGHQTVIREIELQADRSHELEIALQLEAPPVLPPPPPSAVPPEALTAKPPPSAAGGVAAEASPHPRLWTWVAAGVGAASLAAAIGCGVAARQASDEMRESRHDQQTVQGLHDRAAATSLAANVLYGVGAAAGIAGGVLFFSGRF
ncbi:MAG: PEGA domain-containing protein [Deltaproteobacteria bacterium]|nr:PEGA domain-containing protein [Deltaproteobacteria bacterium]